MKTNVGSTRRANFAWALVAVAVGSIGLMAQGAEPRGLLDSKVSTLVGGNSGDGSANAKTVPLTALNGGIARDSAGAIYYTEGNRIIKQTGAALAVYAGSIVGGYDGEGTSVSQASFSAPTYLCTDAADNLYVVDSGNTRIRKITKAGIITTVAGNGSLAQTVTITIPPPPAIPIPVTVTTPGLADIGRTATDARLPGNIVGLAVNAAGDIFFASATTNSIYKIAAADGLLNIIAGDGNTTGNPVKNGVVALGNPTGGILTGLALLADGTVIYAENTIGAIHNIKADGTNVVIAGAVDTTGTALTTLNNIYFLSALYPDDGTKMALQLVTPTASSAVVGGVSPQQITVDGSTIYFFDSNESHIRCFTVGGPIKTVFGEIGEGLGNTGFRGDNSPATTNTPRGGVVITAGPDGILQSNTSGDDVFSTDRPFKIFSGLNNKAESTKAGDDIQVVPVGTVVNDDQMKRNDDPLYNVNNGALVSSGGTVTFVDDGNGLIRQFAIGGNVNTIAGATQTNRLTNLGTLSGFTQNVSNTTPVLGLGAPITTPSVVAQDAAGNLVFDGTDTVLGGHNIYKYDAAAKTVALVAGVAYTTGNAVAPFEGGPGVSATLTSLGAQTTVLADNSLLFADSTLNLVRLVNASGTLTTVAGLPGVAGSIFPDGDSQFLNEVINTAGVSVVTFPKTNRVGQKATAVALNGPQGVLATGPGDFYVADTVNSKILQVAGGVVTHDFGSATDPLTLTPTGVRYLALNGTVLFAASSTTVYRIDLATAQVDPKPTPLNVTSRGVGGTIKGIGLATLGSTPVIVIVTGTGNLIVWQQAVLANGYFTGPVPLIGAGTPGGMFVSPAADLYLTDTVGDTINKLALTPLAGPAATANPLPTAALSTVTKLAGKFTNVIVNGFNLQANFEFTTDTPLGLFADGTILVGDDGAAQFRRVTVGATGNSTTTYFAGVGTGLERTPSADGGPATSATLGTIQGIAVDANGVVYFSDATLNTVRKVAANVITTIAGIPGHATGTYVSGVSALKSTLNNPSGVAVDGSGVVFVADTKNNVVRKINADGTLVTAVGTPTEIGSSGDQFDPLSARLNGPTALAFDKNGDMYISEIGSGSSLLVGSSVIKGGGKIRVLGKNNIMATLAGDQNGDAPEYLPLPAGLVNVVALGITLDAAGKVYYADGISNLERVSGGTVQLVAGDGAGFPGYNGDGLPAARTLLSKPRGVVASAPLGLVFTDTVNGRVRTITGLSEASSSPPTAVITASQTLGAAPLKVTLDGTNSFDPDGDIISYAWDFGDGSKGFGPVVDHIFAKVGSYIVMLTVTDTQGNTNTTQQVIVAAQTLVTSQTTGKGSFKINFSPKSSKPSDSFNLTISGLTGLKDESGQGVTLTIGSFVSDKATVASKTAKNASKTLTVKTDTKKNSVSISLKGVTLKDAFAAFGVTNGNSLGGKNGIHIVVPVVLTFDNGDVLGDEIGFTVTTKFNKGASGNFAQ